MGNERNCRSSSENVPKRNGTSVSVDQTTRSRQRMLELIFFIMGVFIGFTTRDQQIIDRYNKTFDEVDRQVKNDLELYRNLSESYKHDCERLKLEIKKLKDKNET
jgi:hypothetical protein